ncbi:hypothetical protein HY489_01015 [Candidatus Woesearchaeota archaeon]|nr:hypothetical protein [Candidatus Woesearchaeota archaeon]
MKEFLPPYTFNQKRGLMPDELVKRFVDVHAETEKLLTEEKIPDARQKYLQVLDAYNAIEKSSMPQFHKELAHDQVTKLFRRLNDAKERVKVPYNLIAAGILIIAFSVVIFMNPSIVGLVGFEDLVRQPGNVTFTESGLHTFTLQDRPLSLAVSGHYTGNVKLFLKQGSQLKMIFSSENQSRNFTDVCKETCSVSVDSNTIEVFASVDSGSSLTINEISYKVERKKNTAPAWRGTNRNFKVNLDKQVTIDLKDYFSDAEDDKMVFLSSSAPGLDVRVDGSRVLLTGKTPGTKNVIFVASDFQDVTRVNVMVEVQ